MHRRGLVNWLIGGVVGVVLSMLMGAFVVIAMIVAAMARELLRIYRARAFQSTTGATALWIGLASFLMVCLGTLVISASGGGSAIYVGLGAYLVFFLLVEAYDWNARQHEDPNPGSDLAGLLQYNPSGQPGDDTDWDEIPRDGIVIGEDGSRWR